MTNFKVICEETGEVFDVYDVKSSSDAIYFLIFNKGKWVYASANFFVPLA